MSLTPGSRIGPYEVVGPIGAGGMGARGRGERAPRVEPPRRGGGAPRRFLKQTGLAHARVRQWA
jgi:hypothetical protein